MQKIADLYIRVSTDEQADTGYSQRYQDEILRRYCDFHHIAVRDVYFEDHSAKSFQRPQFTKYLLKNKKHRGADLLLFTKWDRFSRNTSDAYQMLATLSRLGIEAQAVEQPLDLSIPENKMMLAVYLAQPEVENHRRALNVAGGMRRAKKEGRWMGSAPIGYKNMHSADGKKSIVPDERQAEIMKWVFEEIAKGVFTVESIFRQAKERGLTSSRRVKNRPAKVCSKNNFWNAIRNPVYCGKIKIDPDKHDDVTLVIGQHQPLISEALFYEVQDVLDGKKRPKTAKVTVDRFPLRGFLQCEECGRILTASSSRGKKGVYYHYYHCTGGCKVRYKADDVESSFKKKLSNWKPHFAVKQLYKLLLKDLYSQEAKQRNKELMAIQDEIAALNERLRLNREFLFLKKIDDEDFRITKKECKDRLEKLEAKLCDLVDTTADIQPLVDDALEVLEHVNEWYEEAEDVSIKREIVGSMFTGKMHFNGIEVRTPQVNEAVQLIFSLGEAFGEIKMGQVDRLSDLSHQVIPLVHFSNTFLRDLRKLAQLHRLAA